jgi:hypothetical protein
VTAAGDALPTKALIAGWIGCACLLFALAWIHRSWRRYRVRVVVHEKGLVIDRPGGRLGVPWTGIRALTTKVVVWHPVALPFLREALCTCRVTCADGTRVVLDEALRDVMALVDAIDQATLAHRLEGAWRTFHDSGAVHFGPLTLTPEGLVCRGKRLPWDQVRAQTVDSDWLLVSRPGDGFPWCRVRPWRVPNVPVLVRLVDTMRGGV